MVDTVRTLAEVLALLPDNTTGQISPQDVRDAIVSIVTPVTGGGFDVSETHRAIGNAAEVDQAASGALNYAESSMALNVWEYFTDESSGQLVDMGVYGVADYHRTTALTGANGFPALFGGSFTAKWRPTAGATGADFNDGVFGVHGSVYHDSPIEPGWIQAATGAVVVADGAVGVTGGISALSGQVSVLGSSPTDPGDLMAFASDVYTERTGAYAVYINRLFEPNGAGVPDELYGLHIGAMLKGAVQSWNIFSAGSTSKNKLEGRLIQGVPNSAPTDAHIGNGQMSAYLDQGGNALTFRVRYSDGTLKTGTVALT